MRRAALILALAALAAAPATSDARPPDHCDPMACPDPVGGLSDCLGTASLTKDPNTGLPVIAGNCTTRDIIWG